MSKYQLNVEKLYDFVKVYVVIINSLFVFPPVDSVYPCLHLILFFIPDLYFSCSQFVF